MSSQCGPTPMWKDQPQPDCQSLHDPQVRICCKTYDRVKSFSDIYSLSLLIFLKSPRPSVYLSGWTSVCLLSCLYIFSAVRSCRAAAGHPSTPKQQRSQKSFIKADFFLSLTRRNILQLPISVVIYLDNSNQLYGVLRPFSQILTHQGRWSLCSVRPACYLSALE